jgi:hypothetical protein
MIGFVGLWPPTGFSSQLPLFVPLSRELPPLAVPPEVPVCPVLRLPPVLHVLPVPRALEPPVVEPPVVRACGLMLTGRQ